jgi:hypothetical protein
MDCQKNSSGMKKKKEGERDGKEERFLGVAFKKITFEMKSIKPHIFFSLPAL